MKQSRTSEDGGAAAVMEAPPALGRRRGVLVNPGGLPTRKGTRGPGGLLVYQGG